MTYPLKPGDILTQSVCGWCDGPVDLRDLGVFTRERQQKLIYYRNLEFDEVPFTWTMKKPARYLPFCSAGCSTLYYEKHVLK